MLDTCKEYLARKRFGIVAYICIIVHLLCGLALIVVVANLRASENGKFSCSVIDKAPTTYQKKVDQACFARYDQAYNSPLPLYGFVPLSFGVAVLISVIYSLVVSKRVDEIESDIKRQTDGEDGNHNHGANRRTVFVIYSYFAHLVLRALLGIIFTVLQHTYFYRDGFDFKFLCNLPPTILTSNDQNTPKNVSRNDTPVTCENSTSSEKWLSGIIVSVINGLVAFVILAEVIYLLPRLPILNGCSKVGWSSDHQFVTVYFLRKRYVPIEFELTSVESIRFYKQQVLNRPRADINSKPKTGSDDLYIDVVIHTGRANLPKQKGDHHEMYDVHTEIPAGSIALEKIKDLFYPNEDTKNESPRSILVIGRPGIGKTVLTKQITRDWANEIDVYYSDKIVFFFKFRWFNENVSELANISLKEFLRYGTGLASICKKFESIYEEIINEPQKAIFIFDGLDEFHGDRGHNRDNPNTARSVMNLFVELLSGSGELAEFKNSTILVTSRPTADDFYSMFHFDRSVEIIGFTPDKVKKYVDTFCDDNMTSNFAPRIWDHIKDSPELLNLCYIPVNSSIICKSLRKCLSKTNCTGPLPTTLTELYEIAIRRVEEYHGRTEESMLAKLQEVAFREMVNGTLVFNEGSFDEQMKKSGLLNSSFNPVKPLQTQFCFVHLTIQEFLAASHVTETFTPTELKKFISDHLKSGKWHLVLQFIAGRLGKKIEMFDEKYYECLLVFAENIKVVDDEIALYEYNHNEFIIKCLKEVDNEKIVEYVSKKISISNVVNITYPLSPNRTVINFVSKYTKNVISLNLRFLKETDLQNILVLLQNRCLNKLEFTVGSYDGSVNVDNELKRVFSVLTNSKCTFNHEHAKLNSLVIGHIADGELPNMCNFFENGHGSQLEYLYLDGTISSLRNVSKLCEALNKGCCTKLAYLRLKISDESSSVFWDTLCKGLCKLTTLNLSGSQLGDNCIPDLCKALQDERCQLATLNLIGTSITDKGAVMLFQDALTKEHCKLTSLFLCNCRLTAECISSVCDALQDERCQLKELSLDGNSIGDKGAVMLFQDALTKEHCKLTSLSLGYCRLTAECISSVCDALQDERCQLKVLRLDGNSIGDEGACMLFQDALTKEHCELTTLTLTSCSLTEQCIPKLTVALQDEQCALKALFISWNNFTENVKKMLRDVMDHESCTARGLKIRL